MLTSADLTGWAMARLTEICHAACPDGNFTIDPRPYGNARKYLRLFMVAHCQSAPVLQIVLDDDDGLAADFMEAMRREFAALIPKRQDPDQAVFVSFARGIGLVFRNVGDAAPRAFQHSYPYITLGLTMLGPRNGKNVFAIDHLAAPRRATNALIKGLLMFVRSLHDHNDSRADVGARWTEIVVLRENAELIGRFPCLAEV